MEKTSSPTTKPQQEKASVELSLADNTSKKRKRRELKGPSGYGIPLESKKRKVDTNANAEEREENEVPANNNYLVRFVR